MTALVDGFAIDIAASSESLHSLPPRRVDVRIPTLGITLAGVEAFIERCGGPDSVRSLSTEAVKERFLLNFTAESRGSYCSELKRMGSHDVGEATHFVSHAWRYKFLDTVDAMRNFARKQSMAITVARGKRRRERGGALVSGHVSSGGGAAPVFFWFDLFSNSQHDTSVKDFEWWVNTFQRNVARIGHTLLVLRWDDPIPLTRAWCIWEIYCTIKPDARTLAHAQLEIIMPQADELALSSALVDRFDTVVEKVSAVDVSNAQSSVAEDRQRIFDIIWSSVGVHEVNRLVSEEMRAWMIAAGKAALEEIAPHERVISPLTLQVSRMLWEVATDDDKRLAAIEMARESVRMCNALRGPDDPVSTAAAENLAYLLYVRGHFWGSDAAFLNEARDTYALVLDRRTRDADSARADLVIAIAACDAGDTGDGATSDAAVAAASALVTRRERARVATQSWYGAAVLFSGDRVRGEAVLRAAIGGWTALGEADSALDALYAKLRLSERMIAQLYSYCSVCAIAYPTYLRLKERLHARHPEVLACAKWVVQGVYHVRDFRLATSLARETLQLVANQLGRTHPYTRSVLKNHAFGLLKAGLFGEAEVILLELIAINIAQDGGCVNWSAFLDYAMLMILHGITGRLFTTRLGLTSLYTFVYAFVRLLNLKVIGNAVLFLVTGIFSSVASPSRLVLPATAAASIASIVSAVILVPTLPILSRVPRDARFMAFLGWPLLAIVTGIIISLPFQILFFLIEAPLSLIVHAFAPSKWDASRNFEPVSLLDVEARLLGVRAARGASTASAARCAAREKLRATVNLFTDDEMFAHVQAVVADFEASIVDRDVCPTLRADLTFCVSVLTQALGGSGDSDCGVHKSPASAPHIVIAACQALALCDWRTTVLDAVAAAGAAPPLLRALTVHAADVDVCFVALHALSNVAGGNVIVRERLVCEGAGDVLASMLSIHGGNPRICEKAAYCVTGLMSFSSANEVALRPLIANIINALTLHWLDCNAAMALVHTLRCVFYSNSRTADIALAHGVVTATLRALIAHPRNEDIVRNAMGVFWGAAFRSDGGRDDVIAAGAAPVVAAYLHTHGRRGLTMLPMEVLLELKKGSGAAARRTLAVDAAIKDAATAAREMKAHRCVLCR